MKYSRLLHAVCFCVLAVHNLNVVCCSRRLVRARGRPRLRRVTWTETTPTIEAYYDTDLNITWLANANLAASNSFGLVYDTDLGTYPGDISGVHGDIYANGNMNWPGAMLWITAMSTANYFGYSGWRLPTTLPPFYCRNSISGYELNCTGIEMGHLFYITLGNKAQIGPYRCFSTRFWSYQ